MGATVDILPSGEAAHVSDGLLYHEADFTSAVHHTNGGRVSDHVFGLVFIVALRTTPGVVTPGWANLWADPVRSVYPHALNGIGAAMATALDKPLVLGEYGYDV